MDQTKFTPKEAKLFHETVEWCITSGEIKVPDGIKKEYFGLFGIPKIEPSKEKTQETPMIVAFDTNSFDEKLMCKKLTECGLKIRRVLDGFGPLTISAEGNSKR